MQTRTWTWSIRYSAVLELMMEKHKFNQEKQQQQKQRSGMNEHRKKNLIDMLNYPINPSDYSTHKPPTVHTILLI